MSGRTHNILPTPVEAPNRPRAETPAELDALLPSIQDKAFKGEL
jgi:hypothetical protein